MNYEKEIYQKVIEIAETTAKQETRLGHIDEHLKGINGKVHDHCGRIKIIETAKTHTKGFIAGMVLVISVIISSVWAIFTHLTGS